MQEVYINIDDSGVLRKGEKYCVYGGIAFFSKKEKDKFITQYRQIVKSLKCDYCENELSSCDKKCPEVKCSKISPEDRRRIMNYINKYFTFGCIINNETIFPEIIENASSKNRFIDFQIRLLIKEIIKKQIKNGIINPNEPLKIIVNIDQRSTRTNGYYGISDGLIEEMKHGIKNFNYDKFHEPIFFAELIVELNYVNSYVNYAVQGADILAGTVRRRYIAGQNGEKYKAVSFLDYYTLKP